MAQTCREMRQNVMHGRLALTVQEIRAVNG
jgi:hypothetical protein